MSAEVERSLERLRHRDTEAWAAALKAERARSREAEAELRRMVGRCHQCRGRGVDRLVDEDGVVYPEVPCPACAPARELLERRAAADPDLRAYGPELMHVQRIDAAIAAGRGAGGIVCPVCAAVVGEFCVGGTIPPYRGDT